MRFEMRSSQRHRNVYPEIEFDQDEYVLFSMIYNTYLIYMSLLYIA